MRVTGGRALKASMTGGERRRERRREGEAGWKASREGWVKSSKRGRRQLAWQRPRAESDREPLKVENVHVHGALSVVFYCRPIGKCSGRKRTPPSPKLLDGRTHRPA